MTQTTNSPKLPKGAVYDKLKLTAQLLLPAIGGLYFALAQIWGLPAGEEVTGTIAVVNTFVGTAVLWMKSIYDASGDQYDGIMSWEEGDEEGDSKLVMKSVDLHALETQGHILLKVSNRPPGR